MRNDCWGRTDDKRNCDLERDHDGPHEPCRKRGHGPTCEGHGMHIRARCKTGCPQFQDGSWMARPFCTLMGTPHPGLRGRKRPDYGEAEMTVDWLRANGIG